MMVQRNLTYWREGDVVHFCDDSRPSGLYTACGLTADVRTAYFMRPGFTETPTCPTCKEAHDGVAR